MVCIHIIVQVYMFILILRGQRRTLGGLLYYFIPYSLETVPLITLEIASQPASSGLPHLPNHTTPEHNNTVRDSDAATEAFFIGAEDLNLDPHDYRTSVFTH